LIEISNPQENFNIVIFGPIDSAYYVKVKNDIVSSATKKQTAIKILELKNKNNSVFF